MLRIFRDGGLGSAPVVQVSQYLEEGSDSVVFGPYELVVDGPRLARLTRHAVMSECAGVVSDLRPAVWRAVVD